MRDRKDGLIAASNIVIAVALCLPVPLDVWANDAPGLMPETASPDATPAPDPTPASNEQTSTSSTQTRRLYGSVKKRHTDATGSNNTLLNRTQDLNATEDATTLQPEKAAPDAYALAAQKLSRGMKLSADEYRSLGIGCAGMESQRPFFQKIGQVTAVYPGSPADRAGIHVGDQTVAADAKDENAIDDPSIPLWQVKLGKAGTPQDITLLRNGRPVTLTVIRMNIEDIQDANVRHKWEQTVRNLGYPKEGTFTGRSLQDLRQNSDAGP